MITALKYPRADMWHKYTEIIGQHPLLMASSVLLLFFSVVTLQGQLCSFYLIIPHAICLFRTIAVWWSIYIFNSKVLIVRLGVM